MSKPQRTQQQLAQEYSKLCTEAGHKAYNLEVLRKDIEALQSVMRDLNIEASTAPKEEAPKAEESANA